MAVAVVQSTGTQPSTTGTLTLTLTSTPTAGNILVAFVAYSQFTVARTITTPSGWTKVDDTTSVNDSFATFWHLVVGGDGKPWSFSVSDATDNMSGALYEISGASTTTPINQHATSLYGNATNSSMTTATVTPSVLSTLALAGATMDNNTLTFSSVSSGWTEDATEDSTYHTTYAAHRNSLTADTTTGISNTFTVTGATATNAGVTAILLIAPPTATTSSGSTRLMMGV